MITTLSATLLIGVFSPLASPANADTDLSKVEQDLNKTRQALATLAEQIKKVDRAISDNRQMIVQTEKDIEHTQEELSLLEVEIEETQKRIDARNDILKERLRTIQSDGGTLSYVDVILGSTSFANFIDRITALTTILNADSKLIEEQEKDLLSIEKKKNKIQKKLESLAEQKLDLEGMRIHIEEQQVQNEALKAQLKEKEASQLAEKQSLLAVPKPQEPTSLESAKTKTTTSKPKEPSSALTATSKVQTVIQSGYKYIGNSVYVFGGGRSSYDIANGRFDCSGFVHWAFSQAGITVGSSTSVLKNQGTRVAVGDMRPGDLVFFNTYKTDGHVGIYIGNGQFIGSQNSTGVAVASMTSGYWKNVFKGHVRRVM